MSKKKKFEPFDLFSPEIRNKILRAFIFGDKLNLSVDEIASSTQFKVDKIQSHLEFFVEVGVLAQKTVDGEEIYHMRVEDEKVSAIQSFFTSWDEYLKTFSKDINLL